MKPLLVLAVFGLLLAGAPHGFTQATVEPAQLPVWTPQNLANWWKANQTPDSWREGAAAIHAAMIQAAEKHGPKRVLANTNFQNWLILARWLSLYPAEDVAEAPGAYFLTEEGKRTFMEVGSRPDLPHILIKSLHSKDDAVRAAEILCQIYQKHPEDCQKLQTLAVAFSVVMDQPFPETWPHTFTDFEKLDTGDSDPTARFAFYAECVRRNLLLLDIRRLSVRELVFLVDSPLKLTEFHYAHQIKLRNPAQLAGIYQAVQYDKGRMSRGDYHWNHPTYRLVDIGRRGGICADQAFFTSQAGKAKGIPTIFFLGQGRSGGHAWVGFLKEKGRWELEVAKYSGDDYPVGVAFDPQTWERVTDQQFAIMMRTMNSVRREISSVALQWAQMNPGTKFVKPAIDYAKELEPASIPAWELESKWMKDNITDSEQIAAFWRGWVWAFRNDTDLKMRGYQKLLSHYDKTGEDFKADQLRQQIIRERPDRFDLSIGIAASIVQEKASENKWEEAEEAFKAAMGKFRQRAGGHLFYNLLEPYVELCLNAGKREQAQRAMKELDRGFKVVPKSLLDVHIKDLIRRVGAK